MQPSFQHFAPPLVGWCAMSPEVKPHHLESLEYIMVGAAPVGTALVELFKKKAPHVSFREGKEHTCRYIWLFFLRQ